MRSLRFILAFALICAASSALADPRILEIQEQAQQPAQPQVQDQSREKPQEKVQDPGSAVAAAAAPQPALAQAPEAAAPPPQGQAPSPAAPSEPAKEWTAEPTPSPARPAPAPSPPAKDIAKDTETPAAGRFSFRRVDGGILRLDSRSGQVAVCASHDAGWACQAVPEERAALEKEIARLQGEVDSLKDKIATLQKEIATLREPPPAPRPPADLAPRGEDRGGLKMPSDEDIARARAAIVEAWQRLMDMIGKLQNDMTRKTTPPERTAL